MLNELKRRLMLRTRLQRLIGSKHARPPDTRPASEAGETFAAMARWSASPANPALDAQTIHQCKRVVLDASVAILAGLSTRESRSVLEMVQHVAPSGACTVAGTKLQTSAAMAAFAGTALCQVHDANDGHPNGRLKGTAFHPGRVLVPTALAVAAEQGLSGLEMLTAIALGYDIATGTSGGPLGAPSDAYGAAAVSCRARGLTPAQTAFVMRVAGFGAPRSGAPDFETNNLTCAQQARSAVEAAMLVGLGYPLSKALGLGDARLAFCPPEAAGASLASLYFKPYPCCRTTHPFIDAAMRMRPSVLGRLNDIRELRLYVPAAGRSVARKVTAGEYFKAYEYSISYSTVATLVDGNFGLRQVEPERFNDALIQTLQARLVFVIVDDRTERGAQALLSRGAIELVMPGGEVHQELLAPPLGGPENPLTDEQIAAKVVTWLGLTPQDAAGLLAAAMSIDEAGGLHRFSEYLAAMGEKVASITTIGH